jgi:hypothetical protein
MSAAYYRREVMADRAPLANSIHPRSWKGHGTGEKRNTSGNRKKPGRVERSIAAIEGHLEKHPNDAMSQSHLTKLRAQV